MQYSLDGKLTLTKALLTSFQIVYFDGETCGCFCNGERSLGSSNCPAGFSTTTSVIFDAAGNCKCDCKMKRKY